MNIDKKKLGEQLPDDDDIVDEIPEGGMHMASDDEDSEFDDFEFDDDGNDTDEYDEEPDIDDDDLDDVQDTDNDDADEEPEEEPVVAKPKQNKLSPADIKVINLKKENAKLAKENAEYQKMINEKLLEKEKVELKKKYEEQGYDEDTAEVYAKSELRMKQLEERQALYDFKEENEDVFKLYPQAKADISTIMRNSKLTGMTAEQICKGMYGSISDSERRAIESVKGNPTRSTSQNDRATTSIKSSTASSNDVLSPKDLKYKRILETKFNGGEKMTVAEYRKYMK